MLLDMGLPLPLTPSHQGRGKIGGNFFKICPSLNTKSRCQTGFTVIRNEGKDLNSFGNVRFFAALRMTNPNEIRFCNGF
jgi:hypothetical protein